MDLLLDRQPVESMLETINADDKSFVLGELLSLSSPYDVVSITRQLYERYD